MQHETALITTLVACLVCAFVGGLASAKLRMPPIIGYLIAGVAIGPYTPGFVANQILASQLAELGVILLMFGVGLHFSVDDLRKVWRIAVPGAIAQIGVATAAGAALAFYWGWGVSESIVFGLSLSVASTVVLLRALDARKAEATLHGRIAIGWLVVEDMAMILALVFLPALAGLPYSFAGGHADGVVEIEFSPQTLFIAAMLMLGKLTLFAATALVAGRKIIPWLLQYVDASGSRELFTLGVLAAALGLAYGSAALFDVSFALGAFFAGMILHESELSHRAARDSLPFQDAFAVLFFISVGMLFNPYIMMEKPMDVLAVLAIIIIVKFLAAIAIMHLFGYPVSESLWVGASLAQIGEFSFILVGVAIPLGLLDASARDLILAGALLSIALNQAVFFLVERYAPATVKHRGRKTD